MLLLNILFYVIQVQLLYLPGDSGDVEAVEQYEVRGLVPASLYEVAVRAFTRAGPGPLSSPRIVDSTSHDGRWPEDAWGTHT